MRAGKLLCLDRTQFNNLLGDLTALRHTWRFEALRRVPLLQQLTNSARGQLCDILEQVIVPKKTRVVSQGDPGDAFYIVETGVLAVLKDGKPVMRLTPGQVRVYRLWHSTLLACSHIPFSSSIQEPCGSTPKTPPIHQNRRSTPLLFIFVFYGQCVLIAVLWRAGIAGQ